MGEMAVNEVRGCSREAASRAEVCGAGMGQGGNREV